MSYHRYNNTINARHFGQDQGEPVGKFSDQSATPKSGLEIVEFKPLRKGVLRGFATVRMPLTGIVLHDVSLCQNGQSIWANPPGKPRIDKDGNLVRENGKLQYTQVVSFADSRVKSAFSKRVVDAVRAAHHEVFD